MTYSRTLLLSFALFLTFTTANAEVRKYSNEFLAIGVGARGLAMSGAQVATISDVTSGYWNPAGLLKLQKLDFQVALMHSEYFAGIAKYDYGGIAVPLKGNKRVVGLSLIRFGIDDIPNTLHLIEPDGTINYNNVSSFSAADYSFIGSYSQETDFLEGLTLGGNVKIIHRTVGQFGKAWGFGLDVGAQYAYKNWRFGAVGRDITGTYTGWNITFTEEEQQILVLTDNELPGNSLEVTTPKLVLGAAYNLTFKEKFTVLPEINFDLTTDGRRNVLISANPVSIDPKIGFEFGYANFIFVRGGIGNIQRATDDVDGKKIMTFQPNAGVGLVIKNFHIDYAFTDIGNQSQVLYSHVFSLKLDVEKKAKAKNS